MDLEATAAELKQLEYTTQFFEFTPDAFVDTINNVAVEMVNENLDALRDKCAEEYAGKVTAGQLADSFTILKDVYGTNVRDVVDKFGRYVAKNFIAIPRDVVLPKDRPHLADPSYKSRDLDDDLKKFDSVRRDIYNAKYAKAVLKAKLANLEVVAAKQEKVRRQAELLEAEMKSHESMFDQQIEILRQKVAVLRPVAAGNNVAAATKKDSLVRKLPADEDAVLAKVMKIDKEN